MFKTSFYTVTFILCNKKPKFLFQINKFCKHHIQQILQLRYFWKMDRLKLQTTVYERKPTFSRIVRSQVAMLPKNFPKRYLFCNFSKFQVRLLLSHEKRLDSKKTRLFHYIRMAHFRKIC